MPTVDTVIHHTGSLQIPRNYAYNPYEYLGTHISAAPLDGKHIAVLTHPDVRIYALPSFRLLRKIRLPSLIDKHDNNLLIRWAPPNKDHNYSIRFLVSDYNNAAAYDLLDEEWIAKINYNGNPSDDIATVDFGLDEFEIVVHAHFGIPLTVWSLTDGTSTNIRDVKFPDRGSGYSRRGAGGVYAVLRRAGTEEAITIHKPDVRPFYSEIHRKSLGRADTMDLKWSPSGQVFATWQAARNGYDLTIHTAEGHPLRTYKGTYYSDAFHGLGIHHVQWSPTGHLLAVGAYERNLALINTATMTPAERLHHAPTIDSHKAVIWVEETAPPTSALPRHYDLMLRRPYALPCLASTRSCISMTCFNKDGTALATRDEIMPSVAFIWSMPLKCCVSVIVQMSKIRNMTWHPSNPDILILQTETGRGMFYRFDMGTKTPNVLALALPEGVTLRPEVEMAWLPEPTGDGAALLLTDRATIAVAYPEGRAKSEEFADGEAGNGDESLFDIVDIEGGRERDRAAGDAARDGNSPEGFTCSGLSAHWREVGAF